MKQKDYKNIFLLIFCIFFSFFCTTVQANENIKMGEEYFGSDMNAAIEEAKTNKRKVNYNNKNWYNRTTSKSFALPPLKANELKNTQLEGALQPTAAGSSIANNQKSDFLIDPLNIDRNQNETSDQTVKETQPSINIESSSYIPDIKFEFTRGDRVETYDIISNGTITSTPRP